MSNVIDYKAYIVRKRRKPKRSILLKGPSGSGKTYQYRCLHNAGLKGLYASVDEHWGTIDDLDPDPWIINNVDVPLMPMDRNPSVQDFTRLIDFMRSDQHEYDFLYFDSLMNFSQTLVRTLKYEHNLRGYDLWGAFGDKMERALLMLVSLTNPDLPRPVHVIATWGVEVGQNWEGRRHVVPIVDGKVVGPRIDYKFDDVIMLQKQVNNETTANEFVAHLTGTPEFDAKVSSGALSLPPIWPNPDLSKLIAKLSPKES